MSYDTYTALHWLAIGFILGTAAKPFYDTFVKANRS